MDFPAEYSDFLAARSRAESEAGSCSEVSMVAESSGERSDQKHFECQFSDETTKFYVRVKFALEFAKLREKVLVSVRSSSHFRVRFFIPLVFDTVVNLIVMTWA